MNAVTALAGAPNFRGNSQLGLLPLLWGTLYISLVSMLVSVPLGLYAAIYLAEYADRRVRSVVKPLIEVIAGIPTVVCGPGSIDQAHQPDEYITLAALKAGEAFMDRLAAACVTL